MCLGSTLCCFRSFLLFPPSLSANVYLFLSPSATLPPQTIRAVQPDVVVVELCQYRVSMLRMDESTLLREAKDINLEKVQQAIKQVRFQPAPSSGAAEGKKTAVDGAGGWRQLNKHDSNPTAMLAVIYLPGDCGIESKLAGTKVLLMGESDGLLTDKLLGGLAFPHWSTNRKHVALKTSLPISPRRRDEQGLFCFSDRTG